MRRLRSLTISLLAFAPSLGFAQSQASLEGFFTGKTKAKGEFSAINGVKVNFDVELTGEWDGRTLQLREDFTFSDGKKDTKTWVFTKINENQYRGTREDVIGETLVTITNNRAKFTYLVYLDSANKKMKVRFHDIMIFGESAVVNNARVTKFGLPIGHTKVIFEK